MERIDEARDAVVQMSQESSGSGPRFLEIEEAFARFVRTQRGGTIVRDLIPDAPLMEPNADYYFAEEDVVAELKCLRTDPDDREQLGRRFLAVCERLGYSAEQALLIALRRAPLPRDVAQATIAKSLSHVRKALRKASDQIGATKRQLSRPSAYGLIIIANENNVSLTPAQLLHFIFLELRAMKAGHIDGLIYVTPNLYHDIGEDGVGRSLWLTGYRRADASLMEFVDKLGAAWCQHREMLDDALTPSVRTPEPRFADFDIRPSSRVSKGAPDQQRI